jgi:hypothetical protein
MSKEKSNSFLIIKSKVNLTVKIYQFKALTRRKWVKLP